jgi:hypothetical protein
VIRLPVSTFSLLGALLPLRYTAPRAVAEGFGNRLGLITKSAQVSEQDRRPVVVINRR